MGVSDTKSQVKSQKNKSNQARFFLEKKMRKKIRKDLVGAPSGLFLLSALLCGLGVSYQTANLQMN